MEAPFDSVFEEICRQVDKVLADRDDPQIQFSEKRAKDFVSEVDLTLAKLISNEIHLRFPTDTIISEEEAGCITVPNAPRKWYVDPIDGTTNFISGFPFFATALTCLEVGTDRPLASLVYAPRLEQCFMAFGESPAQLNGSVISPTRRGKGRDTLLLTGLPSGVAADSPLIRIFAAMSAYSRGTRRSGSAAIDVCWVAAGFADAYYHFSISPWDVLPSIHILRNAGGKATNIGSSCYGPERSSILATNGYCHAEIDSELVRQQAVSDGVLHGRPAPTI